MQSVVPYLADGLRRVCQYGGDTSRQAVLGVFYDCRPERSIVGGRVCRLRRGVGVELRGRSLVEQIVLRLVLREGGNVKLVLGLVRGRFTPCGYLLIEGKLRKS